LPFNGLALLLYLATEWNMPRSKEIMRLLSYSIQVTFRSESLNWRIKFSKNTLLKKNQIKTKKATIIH